MAEAVSRLYGIAADDPRWPAIPVSLRRAARSAIWPCRSRSSWRAGCARRRGRSRRRSSRALGTIEGFSRIEAAPNGYVNFFLDRPALACAGG